jgi:hypothetical protein
MSPNVTPVYRFTITSGTDEYAPNNSYQKTVRFYVQRAVDRSVLVAVKNNQSAMPSGAVALSNKLNTDTVLGALNKINWERADGVGAEDYDLFERDKWPATGLNFTFWRTVIWEQGSEATGLLPEERMALKGLLNSGDLYWRKNLIIAGQDVARIHDVALTASNGAVADQDFVRNYLRSEYRGNTNPAVYENLRIKGVRITPGKYERVKSTGVAGDAAPMPSRLRTTTGEGIAAATHSYSDLNGSSADTMAGVVATGTLYNSIYYAIDWRHAARYEFEPTKSGAYRLLLGALDYIDQFRGILPVKLVSFNAYQSGREAVSVEWRTASEVDVASMEIERAEMVQTETGAIEGTYQIVDRKVPQGNSTTGAEYRVVDHGVKVGAEYHYRLVSVSLEGTRTVEETQVVKVLGADRQQYELVVHPNPIVREGTVSYRIPEGVTTRLALYGASGEEVLVLGESNGSGEVRLPVESLSSGTYTLRLETSSGVRLVEKVVIRK